MRLRRLWWLPVLVNGWFLAQGCTAPGGPDKIKIDFAQPDAAASFPPDAGVTPNAAELRCNPVQSSQVYPPRISVTSGQTSTAAAIYSTSDLFGRFKTICGGCHVDSNAGNFTVSSSTFSRLVTKDVVNVITSSDDAVFMPPKNAGGQLYSSRVATDPVVQLVELLNIWIGLGSPENGFPLPAPDQGIAATFVVSPELGASMTNIGTCVPGKRMVGTEQQPMDDMDAFFAAATVLPATLDKTDLVTLDSDELARRGVISFAPTYPLWTENAGKMRYVRVPRGQTITFDKATQQFHIPPNTRFYKTFLKEVVDVDGHPTWRKMETRVIVSRPDKNGPDGRAEAQTALYGTYIWSDDETTATLLNDPLRNGQPFVDRIVTYVTDEAKAKAIADAKPRDVQRELKNAGLLRHYAFPGALRCVACHMGSPSESFILGFTPLQLARRPTGAGGLYEPGMGDELTQVQRLIDYGVISGMTSPADVLPLEVSQGTRVARTTEELNAQAYMLGNCAHCHNPRGLPTIKQPLLADKLNFLPSETGGIFQFPLDRLSPLRHRGLEQDIPIPYITPSLYDLPRGDAYRKVFCPNAPFAVTKNGDCFAGGDPVWILAPWRSLIYRNVDTPFDYFEDYVPFPHMPLHSPGFDCRAPKIMGDWMVSIPSELIHPEVREDRYVNKDYVTYTNANMDVQPYREVTPDSPKYADAVAAARKRLNDYQHSLRYNFCPSTYTDDIVDPVTANEVDRHLPVSSRIGSFPGPKVADDPFQEKQTLLFPVLQVPLRPNYISFDDTEVPGDWFPRNPLWSPGIIDPTPDQLKDVVQKTVGTADTKGIEELTRVLEALRHFKITDDAKRVLLEEVPSGLWDTSNPKCDFSGIPKVSSFTGADRPEWMDLAKAPPSAPVFMQTPGAAVFTTICYNCHGVMADSKGVLSNAIVTLTGGDARVANFRDGLFGKVSAPGSNRTLVFKDAADKLSTPDEHITSDDLAVRYLAYMALGGTQKHLPQAVLTQVSQAPVFGAIRNHVSLVSSPAMLQLGLALCSQIAASTEDTVIPARELSDGRIRWSDHTGLIDTSGDAEMWIKLCSLGNRPIVRVASPEKAWTADVQGSVAALELNGNSLYWGDAKGQDGKPLFPDTAPFMDHHGRIRQGLSKGNDPFPICVAKPSTPQEVAYADAALKSMAVQGTGAVIPYCPPGFVREENALKVEVIDSHKTYPDGAQWAARGTINAAMAVFLYLDQIERDPGKRKPLFNQCDQLGAGK